MSVPPLCGHYSRHRYYLLIRLLAHIRTALILFHILIVLTFPGMARPLQSTKYNYVNLATLFDPDRTCTNSPFRLYIIACYIAKYIGFCLITLRGCIASPFRIAARLLLCLRLNLTSLLRLQG